MRKQAKRYDQPKPAYFFGVCLNAQIGDKENALNIRQDLTSDARCFMADLQAHPSLDALRADPRFEKPPSPSGFLFALERRGYR